MLYPRHASDVLDSPAALESLLPAVTIAGGCLTGPPIPSVVPHNGPLHGSDFYAAVQRNSDPPPKPSKAILPDRVRILREGITHTSGDRDEEYGPPARNMECAGKLKAVFREYLSRPITPAELEALDMAMTKLSRLACGLPKRDTYVDAAVYFAIAGEVALAGEPVE